MVTILRDDEGEVVSDCLLKERWLHSMSSCGREGGVDFCTSDGPLVYESVRKLRRCDRVPCLKARESLHATCRII